MAYLLIQWLNLTQKSAWHDRITTLLETANKLGEAKLNGGFPAASLNPRKPGLLGTKAQFENLRRAGKLARTLNGMLARYRLRPKYAYSQGERWHISWVDRHHKTGRVNIDIFAGGNADSIPFGEEDALLTTIRLGENGYLSRVRKCSCAKWFFAKFKHQRFCGTPCQQRDFRKTEGFRVHRREYMRSYRITLAKMAGRPFKARSQDSS